MKNKYISVLSLPLVFSVILSVMVLVSCDSNSEKTPKKDYSNTHAYHAGYTVGKSARTLGGASYCSDAMAEEQGACVDQVSKDAWCQGYEDGYAGK